MVEALQAVKKEEDSSEVGDLLKVGNELVVAYGMSKNPRWVINSFTFESEVRELWWKVNPGDIVFDVGAGYGSYTLPAAKAGALVIAFEPGIEEFFDLSVNTVLNVVQDNCYLLPILVGDVMGVVDFFPTTHTAFRISENDLLERRIIVTIDHVVTALNIMRLDWIKIDTEGYEIEVLRGAKESINKFFPAMIIENHKGSIPGIDDKVREILIPLGYREKVLIGGGHNEYWSLWTHPNRIGVDS